MSRANRGAGSASLRPRILLVASTTGYQVNSFADAAARLNIELLLATDRCHVLDDPWRDGAIALRFDEPESSIDAVAARAPFDGIVAVGDRPACAAAEIAASIGIPFHTPEAVAAANNKFLARERFREAGLPTPCYQLLSNSLECTIPYPRVLKPLNLSASRGVIRADDEREFAAAAARIRKIAGVGMLLVEQFIPGTEFALEGLVTDGRLTVLALFDKPDPLDGPFFEETIYVTPSREPEKIQQAIFDAAQLAVTALGLKQGPVHAEMRVNDRGVWMLEIAARPIGGLCSRVLSFDDGASLEQIVLRHAAGNDVSSARLSAGGHAVMMIPIPRAGIYAGVEGVEEARKVSGIVDIVIAAKEGQVMLPLPEGASYLGFLFARAAGAPEAESALRKAHQRLHFRLTDILPVVR